MTNPVVDLVGDRTGKIVPLYPQSDKAGITTWELGGWIEEALERAGQLVDPLPDEWRQNARRSPTARGPSPTSTRPESMAAAQRARAPSRVRRAVAVAAAARHAQAGGGARVEGHPPRRRRRAGTPASTHGLPFELTGRPAQGHRRDRRRPRRSASDAPSVCRATSARARPSWPSARCSSPCRAAPGRARWPRRRCWPSSTTSRARRVARPDRAGRRAPRSSATGRLRVELLTNRTTAKERDRITAVACPTGRSTSWSAPTPCSPSTSRSMPWAWL